MKEMCQNCIYWGGNNKKPINSVGDSYCIKLKKMAHACQRCTKNYERKK